eukprot:CAMPEP_0203910282 /NCGR_PEP_ID=MMETSP0359-20131031/51526_1 /ASSEMBLY_ACC=CAM_ASM_000338 /TAXON_ID=268821 /ORGANISM="Scrippsiella Hangoei, Strain SHTV-5" /LENGTH=35 /DNA_ID= /DNA_START= /DNA_END= /DNA_ORIENTATION=
MVPAWSGLCAEASTISWNEAEYINKLVVQLPPLTA